MLSLLILTALFSSGLSSSTADVDVSQFKKTLEYAFNVMDVNRNGKLDLVEFNGAALATYDANDDHKVTVAELVNNWNHRFGNETAVVGRSLFALVDSNGDGTWMTAELAAVYKQMDTDGDGTTGKAEFIDFSIKILLKAFDISQSEIVG